MRLYKLWPTDQTNVTNIDTKPTWGIDSDHAIVFATVRIKLAAKEQHTPKGIIEVYRKAITAEAECYNTEICDKFDKTKTDEEGNVEAIVDNLRQCIFEAAGNNSTGSNEKKETLHHRWHLEHHSKKWDARKRGDIDEERKLRAQV